MLKIRLQRAGKKNQPYFKMVVTESQKAAKSGRFLEAVGSYNPRGGDVQLKEDRIKHWLSMGVQLSGTAHNMLVSAKIIKGPKINVSASAKKEEEKKEKEGAALPEEGRASPNEAGREEKTAE